MFKELIDQAKTKLSGYFDHVSNVLHAPEELDEGDLPLVRGAAEYFVLDEDFLDDADVAGFTDDASVVSTVRGYLGI